MEFVLRKIQSQIDYEKSAKLREKILELYDLVLDSDDTTSINTVCKDRFVNLANELETASERLLAEMQAYQKELFESAVFVRTKPDPYQNHQQTSLPKFPF